MTMALGVSAVLVTVLGQVAATYGATWKRRIRYAPPEDLATKPVLKGKNKIKKGKGRVAARGPCAPGAELCTPSELEPDPSEV